MNKICAGLVAGLALAAASPAFAQSDIDPDEKAWPSDSFTGTSIEAILGLDHFASKSSKDIDSGAEFESTKSGLAFGGGVGYDFAVNPNITVGFEATVTGSTASWHTDDITSTFNLARIRAGRDIYVGGRVGYAFNPKTLAFVKFGYANTAFNLTGSNTSENLYETADASGIRAGFGLEQKVTKKTFVRLEYDFSHYGTGAYSYGGTTPDASNFFLSSDNHKVLASVGFRF